MSLPARAGPHGMRFVLIPGAGGEAWYWHRVVPLLRAAGHDATAVQLPAGDETAGLDRYVETIVEAAGTGGDTALVGQSMGALSAAPAAAALDARLLVLVAPMIPVPGERGRDWWAATGQDRAARAFALAEGRDPDAPFDPVATFLHDLPPDVLAAALARGEPYQSGRPFDDPWPLDRPPAVSTHVVAARYDRLFPLPFVTRLARERLGLTPDVVDAGHLSALSRPVELVDLLAAYARSLPSPARTPSGGRRPR